MSQGYSPGAQRATPFINGVGPRGAACEVEDVAPGDQAQLDVQVLKGNVILGKGVGRVGVGHSEGGEGTLGLVF